MGSLLDKIDIILISTIRMSVPITLAAVAGVFSARAGIMALGLEGMMLAGAFCAALGSYIAGNVLIGLLAGIIGGVIISLFHGILTIRYKVDHVISGIGLNLLASGITTVLLQTIWGNRGNSPEVNSISPIHIPILGEISPLVCVMILVVILSWIVIFKTTFGLRLRMVGEHPKAASTVGINVNRVKYISVIITGILAGLSGAYLSIDHVNLFVREMTAGRGYIAVVVNILGRYNPVGALGGGLLFGFADSIQLVLSGDNIPGQLIQMIPYIVTLLVLMFAVRYIRPPAGLGKNVED